MQARRPRSPIRQPAISPRAVMRLAVTALGLASLVACAVPPADGPPASRADASPAAASLDDAASTLPIAVELVAVLVQLDGYSPHATTVQANAPRAGFGANLVRALELAGYGIQVVPDDQGGNYLGYGATARETATGGREGAFELRLRGLTIGRRTTLLDGAWVPIAPVEIRGAAPQPVALNGSIHVRRPGRALTYPSGVRFVDAETSETLAEALHRYAYRPTGDAARADGAAAPDPERFLTQATSRLYDGGGTAFALRPASDFAARQVLTLRFPTVSDRTLGADNRRALERLTSFADLATDRFSIASCPADARPTDASAARSARVKAELLTLGVPGDQVLEAGCAGTGRPGDLVVTLERLGPPPVRP